MADIKPVAMGGWAMQLNNQWPAVFRPNNFSWIDFTIIHIEIEHEHAMANWNAHIGLFGFVLYITYSYYQGEEKAESQKIVESLQAAHPGMKVEDPFGVLDELDRRLNEKGDR